MAFFAGFLFSLTTEKYKTIIECLTISLPGLLL